MTPYIMLFVLSTFIGCTYYSQEVNLEKLSKDWEKSTRGFIEKNCPDSLNGRYYFMSMISERHIRDTLLTKLKPNLELNQSLNILEKFDAGRYDYMAYIWTDESKNFFLYRHHTPSKNQVLTYQDSPPPPRVSLETGCICDLFEKTISGTSITSRFAAGSVKTLEVVLN